MLEEVDFEKDVGVILHKSFRPSLHCAKAAKKANSVLGQLCRGVSYRDKDTFMSLYTTFVRPHLEYCAQAWSPWNLGDKDVIESKNYEERLVEMNMVTIEERRKRGDLIQMYKVLYGKDDVSTSSWFDMALPGAGASSTRYTTGALNVQRKEGRTELRKNFWSVRSCDVWNNLPDQVKLQPTTDLFKNALDNIMTRKQIGESF